MFSRKKQNSKAQPVRLQMFFTLSYAGPGSRGALSRDPVAFFSHQVVVVVVDGDDDNLHQLDILVHVIDEVSVPSRYVLFVIILYLWS